MRKIRIQPIYYTVNPDTDDKVLNSVYFFRNNSRMHFAIIDRHQRKQFSMLQELLENKDYYSMLSLIIKDFKNKYGAIDVIEYIF